ncbi:MAG: zinc ribbon domain-containing protein [Oscillospiraceae bacterium]|nr:zinc ribbon domain-containing protein [Oscillospiraceae bacterium]
MYCGKCGAQNPDDNNFCRKCGVRCDGSDFENTQNSAGNTDFKGKDYSGAFCESDIQANKVMAMLAYLLFFLPLVACPDSKFGRFHANQGLIVLILGFINGILQGVFSFGRWGWNWGWGASWFFNPFSIITGAIGFALIAAIVYGIVNAANGKAVEIPVIGKFRIIT